MKEEPIRLVVRLIRENLRLDQEHVVTYNQTLPIPPDDGLFVAVGILDSKPYAGSLKYNQIADGLEEEQTVNVREILSLHFMSKSNEARKRRPEFVFALTGFRAEQLQDANGFLIGKLPVGLVDSSITEGADRLNRYTLTVAVLYAQGRRGPVEFFESYPTQLVTQA